MKFLILLCLIAAVFCTEYSYVGKQACYNHCEKFYKGETQARCFDKCSAMPNSDAQEFPKKELCLMGCKLLKKDWQRELCEIGCNQIKADSEFLLPEMKKFGKKVWKQVKAMVPQNKPASEEFPKKELCLMGCKLLKKDWERQLCEIACNQIKADSELFGKKFNKILKQGLKIGKQIGKEYLKSHGVPMSEGFPKKELCLMGCKLLKKEWERQVCEVACNQIKADVELFGKKFNKILKQGLKVGKQIGKEYLKSKGIPLAEEFPKKELCLMGCKLLKKDWERQLCEIACNQIKSDDAFGGRPKPEPTPCETCKSACVRAQMNIGKCIETCENTTCKLTPSDICKQKCIASQFEVTKCMQKC